jgi:hypothetical protein
MSDIYLSLTETPSVVTLSQPVISSSVAATVTVGNTVTVALDANSLSALENVTVTVGAAVSVSNFPATQVVTGSVAVSTMPAISISSVTISNFPATQVVSVSNLPANQTIAGTVTVGNSVTISGTVTANVFGENQAGDGIQHLKVGTDGFASANGDGRIFAEIIGNDGTSCIDLVNGSVKVTGTVTANNPSGALTTRFGSVTTGNTSQLTSCVTNTSRKFLLVQNIATSTVTIGIGFAPTTTQGIQLTAGAGLTFDAFCPTGGVWWLSSTTGSNFSILEG